MGLFEEIQAVQNRIEENLGLIRDAQHENRHLREKAVRLIVESGQLHLLIPKFGEIRQMVKRA